MTESNRYTAYWRKEGYSLRAEILVWNFTFHTRNSKPDSVLARITSNVIIRLTLFDTLEKNPLFLL